VGRAVRRADIHQHFWPEGLLSSLARRTAPPRVRRAGGGWRLELAGEPPALLDERDFDPAERTLPGLDRILIAPSSPLGIESLPVGEAEALLEDFHAGVRALGAPFELWGSLPLGDPAPERLAEGAVGLCLPAGALASREGLERLGPALDALDGPLFVHPGPSRTTPDVPAWWPAMTSYVAEMSAAWHAWAAWGRRAHPRLRVVFAMLAGLAPLHAGPPRARRRSACSGARPASMAKTTRSRGCARRPQAAQACQAADISAT